MASFAISETREREEAGKEGEGGKREGEAPQVADMRFTMLFFVGVVTGGGCEAEFENMIPTENDADPRSG